MYNATIETIVPTNTSSITFVKERKPIVWSIILYSVLMVISIALGIFFGIRLHNEGAEIKDAEDGGPEPWVNNTEEENATDDLNQNLM